MTAMRVGRQYPKRDEADFRRLVDEAKARHNLSDVVARYTDLKKAGREFKGCCPFHNERTPSFTVVDEKSFFHCFGCGENGDHMDFLVKKGGLTFTQAYEALTGAGFPIVSEEERTKRRNLAAEEEGRRRAIAQSIWHSTVPLLGTPGEVYVRSRGITAPLPETVRFAFTPRWYDPETGETGRNYPAVVCAMQDVHGRLAGVQCIFLRPDGGGKYDHINADGSRAAPKLTFGLLVGSAIRLGGVAESVTTCEGPEDGWTLWQERGGAVWVSCGTYNLPQVQYPPEVRAVTIAGDNGAAGHLAVREAVKAVDASGRDAGAIFPPVQFKDFNDQLRGVRI